MGYDYEAAVEFFTQDDWHKSNYRLTHNDHGAGGLGLVRTHYLRYLGNTFPDGITLWVVGARTGNVYGTIQWNPFEQDFPKLVHKALQMIHLGEPGLADKILLSDEWAIEPLLVPKELLP